MSRGRKVESHVPNASPCSRSKALGYTSILFCAVSLAAACVASALWDTKRSSFRVRLRCLHIRLTDCFPGGKVFVTALVFLDRPFIRVVARRRVVCRDSFLATASGLASFSFTTTTNTQRQTPAAHASHISHPVTSSRAPNLLARFRPAAAIFSATTATKKMTDENRKTNLEIGMEPLTGYYTTTSPPQETYQQSQLAFQIHPQPYVAMQVSDVSRFNVQQQSQQHF